MTFNFKRTIYGFVASLLLACLPTGCAFLQVREDAKMMQQSTILVGIVSSSHPSEDLPVVVAAYDKRGLKRTVLHYTTLHEPGPYELMVPNARHNIVAFGDKNRNLVYDKGEPAGQILIAEQLSLPKGGVIGDMDIVLTEKHKKKIDLPIGFKMPQKKYAHFHSTCPGAIANIDDVVFSAEYGRKGLWEYGDFYNELGGNVYFLEPYDSTKIPILFIHGAAGSPQDWRAFFEGIDRAKYQPWFFYYPSGTHIDSMANLLYWKMANLQQKYKFNKLCVTAHSMGGLVARSFLINNGNLFPSITKFISISTPWGGEELSELGVKYAPGVIPVWRDMQPESDFINSVFEKPLPKLVEHYLFFGHKGNRNILRPNNDKAVTLASQLDQRSQREAKMIYGYDEDHVSILSCKQVLSQYNAILAGIHSETNQTAGNMLTADFLFETPEEHPKPISYLYLHPTDDQAAGTWTFVNFKKPELQYGPFPSGNYEISIITPAFTPEPIRIPVTIEEGRIPNVQFTMKPSGLIRGFVVNKKKSHLSAGRLLRPDADIEIQSILLTGNGIERKLIPIDSKVSYDDLFAEHYLSETDYSCQGAFFFFGLPTGEYELIFHTKGYESYSRTCVVKAGYYQNIVIIDLVEKNLLSP